MNPLLIILANEADPVERYAGEELQKYIRAMYGFAPERVSDVSQTPDDRRIIIGRLAGSLCDVPALSADGFWLRTASSSPETLVIVGGSPRGTLFGVYELLERWGVRFLLSGGEVLPENPEPIHLTGFDEIVEPAYPVRALRPMANLPEGAAPWDLPDFTAFIDQMARLKFNTFVFVIMESGPWLDYEFRGMKRPAGDVFYGYRFPIDDEFVGNELFPGKTEFYSPVLARASDDDDRRKQAGIELVRSIIRHCRQRGLMTTVAFSLLDPPTEFKHRFNEWATLPLPDPATLAHAHFTATPVEELGINPQYAAWMNVLDPAVQELIACRLRSLINTYPDADFYHLWVSEHRSGVIDANTIFRELDEKYHLAPDFDWDRELQNHASSPFDSQRYQNQMKADLLFLYALDKILNERRLLASTVKPHAAIGVAGVMPQLAPIVVKMLPKHSTFVQFLDYGSHGTARHVQRLKPLLSAGIPTSLEIGIQDDNNMYFPQANVESLEQIVAATAPYGLKGYVAALWQVRQSDLAAAYLSRASWSPAFAAAQFYDDFVPRWIGASAAAEFEKGHRAIEVADRKIRPGPLYGYAFVFNENLIKTFLDQGVNHAAINEVKPLFELAHDHFVRAMGRSSARGRPYLEFWIKRTRFAIDWLDFVTACADCGQVIRQQGHQQASKSLEELLARSRKLIELIAGDASHCGDLGQIANLNQHVHRYLKERLGALALETCADTEEVISA